MISSKVPVLWHQKTLIEYLSGRFTYLRHDEWEARIAEGTVTVEGERADSVTALNQGQVVSYDMPEFTEPYADLDYSIIYEDEWILGIDKPGNLLVHHQGMHFRGNLIYQLRYVNNPLFPDADIINRLDRETSGLVLVSKVKEAVAPFHKLFITHAVHKEYYAVVNGVPESGEFTIDAPLGKDPSSAIKSKHAVMGVNAKEAVTRFVLEKRLANDRSLLKVFPVTGRTHQIRVHCAYAGLPIVGDKLYNLDESVFFEWAATQDYSSPLLEFPRQALHCSAVAFVHPFTKKETRIESPIRADMQTLIN